VNEPPKEVFSPETCQKKDVQKKNFDQGKNFDAEKTGNHSLGCGRDPPGCCNPLALIVYRISEPIEDFIDQSCSTKGQGDI
jgi:hypothetical protein